MYKSLNYDIDDSWVDWAIEMIENGYDTESLYILAGISKPYNQFELQELVSRVLKDLKLDYSDQKLVVYNYAYFLVTDTLNKKDDYMDALNKLHNLCLNLDMDREYQGFSLLYYAKGDLMESDIQWYWDGANRGNIDQIVIEYFLKWKAKYELANENRQ